MQIVIDVNDEIYKEILSGKDGWSNYVHGLIRTGTPLPKHGTLKDFEKIYADMKEKEELARQRVIDTPTNSPCYMRYMAQLNERTAFKEMLYDALTIIEEESEGE